MIRQEIPNQELTATDRHMTMLRLQLAIEFEQAGRVTPRVLYLSQILDKLIVESIVNRNPSLMYGKGQALARTTG